MSAHWTDVLLDKVRTHAAAGDSVRRTAELLNVSARSLSVMASKHRIRFHSRVKPVRAPLTRTSVEARLALAREIAAAKAEAPQAPLYRGWP